MSMKRLIVILLLALCLCSCGYEETREYPVESMRYYVKTIEEKSGSFTTETNTYEYIEFVYIDYNGNYQKDSKDITMVEISNESKVVEKEGNMRASLYLTIDDYNELMP